MIETSIVTAQLTTSLEKESGPVFGLVKEQIRRKVAPNLSQSKLAFTKYGSEDTREGARMQVLWPVREHVISLQTAFTKTHGRKAVFVPVL